MSAMALYLETGRNVSTGATSTDGGGSEFGVTGGGGSFSNAALDGTTRATIGDGNVTVRSQSDEETAAHLADTNRDLDMPIQQLIL